MDLKAQSSRLRDELLRELAEVIDSAAFVLGPKVSAFEEKFAACVGANHCIAVNTGASALHLALICAGVGPGSEVITVPLASVATAWAISYVGARPVFVDVEPLTCTMDVLQIEGKITPRTRAILPVHLYGQAADLNPILALGRKHGIPVIEDAAEAHGARYQDCGVGSLGQSGCFSFFPGKNLGACGEGGAVVTNDDQIAARVRALRDHAQSPRCDWGEIGFNYRMDAFQAAALSVKLKHLERWTQARILLAERYLKLLAGLPIQLPAQALDRRHVWHRFVVRHPQRDHLRAALEGHGIQTGLHYSAPVHLQRAYAHLGHRPGDFPVAEQIARECLTLPLYPEMTIRQHDAVIEALTDVLQELEGQWSVH
jgi:dTDP-4-amino-4,6-dideoxygalactose transaminase